jgi:hypothetical protein
MEADMRTLVIGMLAAAGIALAMPANAEGVYVGAGPVGVGVGVHRDHDWRRDRDETVVVHRRHCRTIIVHEHGYTKKIRRCD